MLTGITLFTRGDNTFNAPHWEITLPDCQHAAFIKNISKNNSGIGARSTDIQNKK
jgi:hypothetical protein